MRIESINVGAAAELQFGGRTLVTGIRKSPVSGDVYIAESGVGSDAAVDEVHHGGRDQAVYAYSADDYDWWENETGKAFVPGQFGENLTIRGMPTDMTVGDRLLVGEVVLEATSPRIPCSTLAMQMQDSSFGLRFRKAERPGIYFRVLNEGHVATGAGITYVASAENYVTIVELFRFNYAIKHQAVELQNYLLAPLAERMRAKVQSRLDALQA